MKFLYALAPLIAAANAQFAISLPKAGETIKPGSDITVQLIVPYDTSAYAGQTEVSLAIGIVNCGTAACPKASADLGEKMYLGKYEHQGTDPSNPLNGFANFTVPVPSDISGKASIQVQHNFLTTPPGHAYPTVEYTSREVTTSSTTPTSSINIHPNGDNNKCIGILGGAYTNGASVDIYDCNGSATQKWQWNGNSLQSTNPTDQSTWCLDAGLQSTWADGLKIKIWQCYSNLPQQTWTPVTTSGPIKLTTANYCLDLTEGDKTNRNILQIWTCVGNTNQVWTVTSA